MSLQSTLAPHADTEKRYSLTQIGQKLITDGEGLPYVPYVHQTPPGSSHESKVVGPCRGPRDEEGHNGLRVGREGEIRGC